SHKHTKKHTHTHTHAYIHSQYTHTHTHTDRDGDVCVVHRCCLLHRRCYEELKLKHCSRGFPTHTTYTCSSIYTTSCGKTHTHTRTYTHCPFPSCTQREVPTHTSFSC